MAHLSGKQIGKHARVLAAALALGAAVLSLSAGQAEAKPRHPVDNGVRCWIKGGPDGETWTAYMPGDVVILDGLLQRCGSDGHWTPARKAEGSTVLSEPVGGGVLAPTP